MMTKHVQNSNVLILKPNIQTNQHPNPFYERKPNPSKWIIFFPTTNIDFTFKCKTQSLFH